ncbi:and polyadenylation specificity factor subunit 1 [Seminavis robusta]|uniref:And polyadenylation specificity factor subunit 1 n=1 Tax=Seminavis robusta TaxID=568900 RepID=A0A9N8DIU7_9STRA|nr:and polyadenylation specificity factor subunit 1 [Seminavis robusta]|eukprot:Sro151_g069100.1 and polyadenylation specificity factor subunit 1 (1746) ;mRNA; r:31700-37166
MPAPNSRPVHPCVMPVFPGGSRGSEYSTWAYITTRPPNCPNLVTAQASTLVVYTLNEASGKLCKHLEFPDLAGNICYLETLPAADDPQDNDGTTTTASSTATSTCSNHIQMDSLLVGFCGHPQLAIVKLADKSELSTSPKVLSATSLMDLTQPLIDSSSGSITPLDQDLMATTVIAKNNADRGTVSVTLGGGVAVACIDILRKQGGWIATEPFLLPLKRLQASVRMSQNSGKTVMTTSSSSKNPNSNAQTAASSSTVASIATGFGDIISSTFLPGYSEPTLVLLHSQLYGHGRVWSGRLGRPHWQPGARTNMVLTAISVTVAHKRSAVLWSVAVPIDAIKVHPMGSLGCLVVCTNSLCAISNAGRIEDVLAVNGYARSTCPTRLLGLLKPNPKPFPKLAIQLDGAEVAFCSDRTAFVALRTGALHVLQMQLNSDSRIGSMKLTLFPVGRSLGACGNVANLLAWPLATLAGGLYDKMTEKDKKDDSSSLSMGLLFAGSRLGDSYLLGYAFETVTLPWDDGDNDKAQDSVVESKHSDEGVLNYNSLPIMVSLEEDEIMRLEEEALYAPSSTDDTPDNAKQSTTPNVVPPSDDETDTAASAIASKRGPTRVVEAVILRAVNPLDTVVGLGPLVAPCQGPIASRTVPPQDNAINQTPLSVPGVTAMVFPCGFGSSGGLAVLTLPGQDERSILSEADCLGVEAVFSLRKHRLVLLGKAEAGIKALRIEQNNASQEGLVLMEIDSEEYLSAETTDDSQGWSARELFLNATLVSCSDLSSGAFCVAVAIRPENESAPSYGIGVLKETSNVLNLVSFFWIPSQDKGNIVNVAPMMACSHENRSAVAITCTWSTGSASLVAFDQSGVLKCVDIAGSDDVTHPSDAMDVDEAEQEGNQSSKSSRVVAVDLFHAPSNFFAASTAAATGSSAGDASGGARTGYSQMDQDEDDLYFVSKSATKSAEGSSNFTERVGQSEAEQWKPKALFVAVCRQNGKMEIRCVADMLTGNEEALWSTWGCAHGQTSLSGMSTRSARQYEATVYEIRFFFCGPSTDDEEEYFSPRPLCLAIETSNGDLLLYAADPRDGPEQSCRFTRVPLGTVSRVSQEQGRFHAKLKRRKIVSNNSTLKRVAGPDGSLPFRHIKLHRFLSLSGQDGLFAAVARPLWFCSDRGQPVPVVHRARHAAPAGGKAYPLSGFCSDLDEDGAFITVHERVGRFGTQRLSVHKEISPIFQRDGLLPGGGFLFEKIKLGVTVRRIEYIADSPVASGGSCLYAVLVSRELDADSSNLNDDGITQEERERIAQEKEKAKIQRQVEADLGGFDVEQEWVEEIEREDCFRIDKELGGAPPLTRTAYSLWIVDAGKGWIVLDSYEFGEHDHGLAMQVMSLTDFPEEPGSSNANQDSEDMGSIQFITVGVGVVDKNGEDVSARGRVLLFELRGDTQGPSGLEMALVCEKEIFHGPVSSLSCLVSEGKHRLIIGAGADVNVEQWGNGKLTQVGFFRATMQILDIFMFKNFLLLSDAYDSLYFLVFRESDKSLTLLSKDYDPLCVYAAGVLSRGGNATFVTQDDRQNVQFFQYAPGEAAARGGNKLVCRGDFHLGSQTTAFRNHSCRSSLWINSASPSSTLAALKQQDALFGRSEDDQRLGVHFGTTDGGFGAIIPLSEPVYWRLAALQSVMANALESDCSLSQRAWRLYKRSHRRGGCRSTDRKKGVIDGGLIVKYADLPVGDQEDLASAIGSTVDLILDNILELNCSISVI